MANKKETIAIIETAIAISLWALSFIWIKIALADMSPVTLIVLRYAMGSVILLGAAIWRREIFQIRPGDLKAMAILGLIGIVLQQFLQVTGQVTADANVAAFLAATAPAFMVVLAAWWLRETVSKGQVIGVFIATLGAAIVAVGGQWSFLRAGSLIHFGNILVLLSAVVWAIYTILTRKLVLGRPPILVAGGMLSFGCVFTLPLWVYQHGWQEFPKIGSDAWAALICVGVFSTAITYLLYSHALKLAPASRLSAIQNIEPFVATLAAVWILREPISISLIIGGSAILAGVYLAERKNNGETEPLPEEAPSG